MPIKHYEHLLIMIHIYITPLSDRLKCGETQEHSKQLHKKVTKKQRLGDRDKQIPKSLKIPWSAIKSIFEKWKQYGTCKKGTSEGDRQDTCDSSEGPLSFHGLKWERLLPGFSHSI